MNTKVQDAYRDRLLNETPEDVVKVVEESPEEFPEDERKTKTVVPKKEKVDEKTEECTNASKAKKGEALGTIKAFTEAPARAKSPEPYGDQIAKGWSVTASFSDLVDLTPDQRNAIKADLAPEALKLLPELYADAFYEPITVESLKMTPDSPADTKQPPDTAP